MRQYSDGNLAKKLNQQSIPYELPDVYVPQLDEIDPDYRNRERHLLENNKIRLQYKSLSRWRAKVAFQLFAVLLALAAAIGFIVWRGAKLTEMSFYNAGLKRQISELDKENSLLQDRILNKSSLYAVKDIAASELGLQKPGTDQIVHVPAAILMSTADGEETNTVQQHSTVRVLAESMALIESWVRSR